MHGPKPYRMDSHGRVQFRHGYEPTATELVETAKDEFSNRPHRHVYVTVGGGRYAKHARLYLYTLKNHSFVFQSNDRPSTAELLEEAKMRFPHTSPSNVKVGIMGDTLFADDLHIILFG